MRRSEEGKKRIKIPTGIDIFKNFHKCIFRYFTTETAAEKDEGEVCQPTVSLRSTERGIYSHSRSTVIRNQKILDSSKIFLKILLFLLKSMSPTNKTSCRPQSFKENFRWISKTRHKREASAVITKGNYKVIIRAAHMFFCNCMPGNVVLFICACMKLLTENGQKISSSAIASENMQSILNCGPCYFFEIKDKILRPLKF